MLSASGKALNIVSFIILCLWGSNLHAQVDSANGDIIPMGNIIYDDSDTSITIMAFHIRWTAPGDDGNFGTATMYDIRALPAIYGPIDTQEEWDEAYPFLNEPTPSPAGQIDSMFIAGLPPGSQYYFSIRAYDDANNISGFSNSPLIGDTLSDYYIAGDVNNSGEVNGIDVVFLLSCLKGNAIIPEPQGRADVNGIAGINGLDVAYLIAYFRGGPPPQYPFGYRGLYKIHGAHTDIDLDGNNRH